MLNTHSRPINWSLPALLAGLLCVLTAIIMVGIQPRYHSAPQRPLVSQLSIQPCPAPEGQNPDGYRYYLVEYTLTNEGTVPLSVDDYHYSFDSKNEDAGPIYKLSDSQDPPLLSRRVLPAGMQMEGVQQILRVHDTTPPEEVFPLILRYDSYQDEQVLAQIELP